MPSFMIKAAATALLGAASVAAHGHVIGVYDAGGEFHQGWRPAKGMGYGDNFPDVVGWTTTVRDDGYISKESHGNDQMACHRGASAAALSIEVAAGDVLTLEWDTWPVSHHGPVMDYLAPCGSSGCASAEAGGLEFFKISEVGCLTPGTGDNGVWGADLLIAQGNKWQVQIPEVIAAGEYVLRHEILALHSLGEPQHYPQCINLVVTGGGKSRPAGMPASELYTDYEDFNIYRPFESYPIPGPAMVAGSAPILDQGSGEGVPLEPVGDDGGDFDEGEGEDVTTAAPAPKPTTSTAPAPEKEITVTVIPAPKPTSTVPAPKEETTVIPAPKPTSTVPAPKEETTVVPAPKPTSTISAPKEETTVVPAPTDVPVEAPKVEEPTVSTPVESAPRPTRKSCSQRRARRVAN